MKKGFVVITILVMSLSVFCQKSDNDTISVMYLVRSLWAVEYELGAAYNGYWGQDYLKGGMGTSSSLKIIYNNFFLGFNSHYSKYRLDKPISIDGIIVQEGLMVQVTDLSYSLGYIYDINQKWSADFSIGISNVKYTYKNSYVSSANKKDEAQNNSAIFNLGVDRYFKMKRYNYFVVSSGVYMNTVDHRALSADLPNNVTTGFYLSVGYKGYFRKIVK